MIGEKTKMLAALVAAAAALALAGGSRMAFGQSGVCCNNTVSQPITCQGPGCSEGVSIVICQNEGYGDGSLYQSVVEYCCSSPATTLVNPSGVCQGGGDVASRQQSLASGEVLRVWVRNCHGRYVLLRLPVAT